jgi:nitrate reductase gamma subunit
MDGSDAFKDCLACHNPHYPPSSSVDPRRVDPARPPAERCSACHVFRAALPAAAGFDGARGRCMECHQAPDLSQMDEHARVQAMCFHCHAADESSAGQALPPESVFISRQAYRSTPHAGMACLACHPRAAGYGHASQSVAACSSCHTPHDEKKAHEAHLRVSCEACHLPGVQPVRQSASGRVTAMREPRRGEISHVHAFMTEKDLQSCRSCHAAGNAVGAADMVLPPKSIICMPCHAATFSAGDTVSIVSLLVFGAGMLMVFSFVLSGSLPGRPSAGMAGKAMAVLGRTVRTLFSRRLPLLIQTLFWDVLLQRRLYRRSRRRWLVHSLIFIPFVIRFTWGMAALLTSLWYPQWGGTWVLLDKNHPATAFVYDLTGLLILLGLIWAFVRDTNQRSSQPADLSRQDRPALLLIGLLVLVGFILEGARIAMTGTPPGSQWAFVGYLLSILFSPGAALTAFYGYLWYLHAILGGAFVAYLPFSRLLHIIVAPIALSMQAVADHGHKTDGHH